MRKEPTLSTSWRYLQTKWKSIIQRKTFTQCLTTHHWGRVHILTLPTTVTSCISKDWRIPLHLASSFNLSLLPRIRIPQEHVHSLKETSGNEGLFTCSHRQSKRPNLFRKVLKKVRPDGHERWNSFIHTYIQLNTMPGNVGDFTLKKNKRKESSNLSSLPNSPIC